MRIQKCSNGCLNITDDDLEGCMMCESTRLEDITSPDELMLLAESERPIDFQHILADAALIERIKQIDPKLYERYERLRKRGFYYS